MRPGAETWGDGKTLAGHGGHGCITLAIRTAKNGNPCAGVNQHEAKECESLTSKAGDPLRPEPVHTLKVKGGSS
jgi:hypothetical protein